MGKNKLKTSLRNSTLEAMEFIRDGALISSSKEEIGEFSVLERGKNQGYQEIFGKREGRRRIRLR